MKKYRDASNKCTYDEVGTFLAKHVDLTPLVELTIGMDEMYQDYKLESSVIGFRMGYMVGV